MATGGDFGREDPDLDYQLDHDDDDDEQEVNNTQPFQPDAASTPYHGGEEVELKTMQQEKSGMQSVPEISFQEASDTSPLLGKKNVTDEDLQRRLELLRRDSVTGLLDTTNIYTSVNPLSFEDKQIEIQKMRDFIKKRHYLVNFKKLGPIRFSTNPKTPMDIVSVGPKGGETKIALDNGKGFRSEFLNRTYVKNALGPKTEDIIKEDRASARELRLDLKETEKNIEKDQQLLYQIEKERKEVETLLGKKEKAQSTLDAIHSEHGSSMEMEIESNRLKQHIKNYETDVKNNNKKIAQMEKQLKNTKKMEEKASKLRTTLAEKDSKINTLQERLNQTKQLDDLKEQESELQRKNAEDQATIQDDNTSPSNKQAAEARVAERNEEIARLRTAIEERERARPLLERVKEIFKKYGVTVASVLLAAGVTIGVVVSSITNALKASTKALGKGLKDIGAKLGSLLPGLIGSIANFLFKAAGQAIGFLAEHTWLLILAVVAFLFEKYQKKRS